jgi:hypothetical protein
MTDINRLHCFISGEDGSAAALLGQTLQRQYQPTSDLGDVIVQQAGRCRLDALPMLRGQRSHPGYPAAFERCARMRWTDWYWYREAGHPAVTRGR